MSYTHPKLASFPPLFPGLLRYSCSSAGETLSHSRKRIAKKRPTKRLRCQAWRRTVSYKESRSLEKGGAALVLRRPPSSSRRRRHRRPRVMARLPCTREKASDSKNRISLSVTNSKAALPILCASDAMLQLIPRAAVWVEAENPRYTCHPRPRRPPSRPGPRPSPPLYSPAPSIFVAPLLLPPPSSPASASALLPYVVLRASRPPGNCTRPEAPCDGNGNANALPCPKPSLLKKGLSP